MFDLTISLDVTGRRAVVVGGGAEAVTRVDALLHAGAEVVVVTPTPAPALVRLADAQRIDLRRRAWRPGDLAGALVGYNTREDDTPVAEIWAESRAEGVLFSTLDDRARCDFATPSVVRRGDLAVTVSTAGRAPALAKRLRQRLEAQIGPEYAALVDVLDAARREALPREVDFATWARRWSDALADLDGLAATVGAGHHDEARRRVVAAVGRGGR